MNSFTTWLKSSFVVYPQDYNLNAKIVSVDPLLPGLRKNVLGKSVFIKKSKNERGKKVSWYSWILGKDLYIKLYYP